MTSAISDDAALTLPQDDCCFENYAYVNTLYSAYVRGLTLSTPVVAGAYIGCESEHEAVLTRVLSRSLTTMATPPELTTEVKDSIGLCRSLLVKALMGCDFDDSDREENVGLDAIVDVAEDLLATSVRRGFSTAQTQQLLLLFQQTFQDIVNLKVQASDAAAEEAELEGRVAKRLTKRIQALTTISKKFVAERVTKIETVVEEIVDPMLVAALEAKKDPKGNKKQLQAIDDAIRCLPKMKVEKKVPMEVTELVEIVIHPIFSFADCAVILNIITSSLFTHWRLFRVLGTEPREVNEVTIRVRHHDIFPQLMPPLTSAMTEAEYLCFIARVALCDAAESAVQQSFRDIYENPLAALHQEKAAVAEWFAEQQRIAEHVDLENQLSPIEYKRTVAVLANRAAKKVTKSYVPRPPVSTTTAGSGSPLVPQATPGAADSSHPTPSGARPDSITSSVTIASSSPTAGASPTAAASEMVLFSIDDIEARIQKLVEVAGGGAGGGPAAAAPVAAAAAKKK